jgi:hypothetical protein
MAPTATVPRVVRTALGLLVAVVAVGSLIGGADFGAAALAGGVAMLGSFGFSALIARRVSTAVENGFSAGAGGMVLIKVPVLMIVLWAMFERFDVFGVVAGGCVVVLAIIVDAVRCMDQPMAGAA